MGHLPLHWALSRYLSSISSLQMTLTMIEKYPEAIKLHCKYGSLPLHLECNNHCRPSIISKCIELYPEALAVCDQYGSLPFTIALSRVRHNNMYECRKSLSILLSAHPASFYHPPDNRLICRQYIMKDDRCRCMILNLLPSCLSSAVDVQGYHDLNWLKRCSLLQLCLQIRLNSKQVHAL
jgi:hypothetical protein